jgi:hypothetical protein
MSVCARHHNGEHRRVVRVTPALLVEVARDRAPLLAAMMLVEPAGKAGFDTCRAFHRRVFDFNANTAQARRSFGTRGACTLTSSPPFAAGVALSTVGGAP